MTFLTVIFLLYFGIGTTFFLSELYFAIKKTKTNSTYKQTYNDKKFQKHYLFFLKNNIQFIKSIKGSEINS